MGQLSNQGPTRTATTTEGNMRQHTVINTPREDPKSGSLKGGLGFRVLGFRV